MLKVYCWRCGTKIKESNILGLGQFDDNVGKYKGKAFIAFKCPKCEKVRYQILDKNTLPKKKLANTLHQSVNDYNVIKYENKIDIDQVIDFHESLNSVNTVDGFLTECEKENDIIIPEINKPIIRPLDVFNLFKSLNESNKKRILILTLDKDNYLITWEFIGEDTGIEANYEPKNIFHTSFLVKNRVSVIIADNLKQNFNNPSQKEILITKRLVKAGKLLGIDFLDHIIISEGEFHSFDQLNLL